MSTITQSISKENLEMIGFAWQHDHQSHQHKGERKKYHQNESSVWLEIVTPLLGKNARAFINRAFEEDFNGMVRTSSLIEMVNSKIRPYINECKGQIRANSTSISLCFTTIIIMTRVVIARGVTIFAQACFGHPSPSKRQKLNATAIAFGAPALAFAFHGWQR